MKIQLPERLRDSPIALAARTGRSAYEPRAEAVDLLAGHEDWFAAQSQLGIDQIAKGEFLDEGQMDGRVARMLEG